MTQTTLRPRCPARIFADSRPFAKTCYVAANLSESTIGLLTRFVVVRLNSLHSSSQAADSIGNDPRHRAQLVRILARQGWAKDWITFESSEMRFHSSRAAR